MDQEQEGVIKFELDYEPAPALSAATLAPLNGWRHLLFQLRLIGQDPERYGGLGFGNLSQRLTPRDGAETAAGFVISGTQTGGLPHLQPEHYAWVLACDPQHNRVTARGPVKPSSECLTHGVLYQLDAGIQAVLHVHSPDIWRLGAELLLPTTNSSIAYGTPEMAQEVQRIYPSAQSGGVFCMGGHEDGVVAFGDNVQQAGQRLTAVLAQAFARLSD